MPDEPVVPLTLDGDARQAAQVMLDNVELRDIRPARLAAYLADGASPADEINVVNFQVASGHLIDVGVYSNRFDFKFELLGSAQEVVAVVEFDLILDYTVREAFLAELPAAEYVSRTTGYFAAFPYARELLQRMATSLRLPPVVLGYMRRNERGEPGTVDVTVVRPG